MQLADELNYHTNIMPPSIYFTPGPSALYFTVEEHLRSALREQIPSISHRSKQFSTLYEQVVHNLRELVDLPDNYHVFFTSSATEIWERTLQSCVVDSSLHLVNGAFSNRFYAMASQIGKTAMIQSAPEGAVVTMEQLDEAAKPELVAVTHNETSTGAQQPVEDLLKIRVKYPEALISVDVVSSFPQVELPFEAIDCAYFSVQKCMGLPAGLGVWMINQRAIDRALALEKSLKTSYHGIGSFWRKYQNFQTPATPNVLSIYLFNKVLQDMLQKGLSRIRMEGKYKAALLYQLMETHQQFSPFVKEASWRSQTVVVAHAGERTPEIIESLAKDGLMVGSGYGPYNEQHIRIANFPTHSKEQMELLVDKLTALHP